MTVRHRVIFLAFLSFHVIVTDCANNSQDVTVTIPKGKIRGLQDHTQSDTTYYAFRGIRYAQPPVGDLRFENPVPIGAWNGTYDAREDRAQCIQGVSGDGSEDCLFLSVYTPSLNSSTPLPVLVWIHGGFLLTGNASFAQQDPEFLLDENIIFVEIQYRLGIFGFISTDDEVLPGNVGHRDQLLALKWVHENIQYFGGDKDKVTLGGQSSGAVSVSVLTQSPLAKGLFRSVIMQSATSLCLWSRALRANDTSFKTGLLTGNITQDSRKLKEHLKTVDVKNLQKAFQTSFGLVTAEDPLAGSGIGTVLEPQSENALFSNNSYDSLKAGNFNQVPMLVGVNSNEASYYDGPVVFLMAFSSRYDVDHKSLAPIDMTDDDQKRLEAGNEVKNEYWGLLPVGLQDNHSITYISDSQFVRPIREFVRQTSKHVPVYFYEFSYEGDDIGKGDSKYAGVMHGAELQFLFKKETGSISDRDRLTRRRLTRMWANFVKDSNPIPQKDPLLQNVTWPTSTVSNNFTYLDIGDDLVLANNISEKEMTFWDNLYAEYGKGSYDTY
ncbi:unnamed protein product [Acanthoscelides obtectus]|uniref:Carboxylic ester hydrolase n=1 Tax=Acanthoscelides obtectus TaxID=200917 RepID=A0A9P0KJ06_ACAOB|nr:unnamed protein product [Acanthoscelides obtectus]CAK1660514.1 hypothetical protein AOBTE_LOCUS22128 [Acanthoscelides obtectus]